MVKINKLHPGKKSNHSIQFNLVYSQPYNQFKGDPVHDNQSKYIVGNWENCNNGSFQDEIQMYNNVYQYIKKNPKIHKKITQQQKLQPKKCDRQQIKKQQKNTTNNKLPTKNKIIHKQPQLSTNWKQYLSNKQTKTKKTDYQFVAIDCQFVKSGETQHLARVSLVNQHGQQLIDSYVKPKARITDYVTNISGITYHHIKNAPSLSTLLPTLKQKLLNKIIIGHTTQKDLQICQLNTWKGYKQIIDISNSQIYNKNGKKYSLKSLASNFLGKHIQDTSHSSVQDAKTTMELFLIHQYQILKENLLIK